MNDKLSIITELKRKFFHLTGMIFPILYYFQDKSIMMFYLLPITIIIILIDFVRLNLQPVQSFINRLFAIIIRTEERYSLSGISFFLLGISISLVLFSKSIAIISWLVLIICDSIAAICGKYFGTPIKKFNNKSWIGTLSFFLSSNIICYSYGYGIDQNFISVAAVFACLITSYGELVLGSYINDNLSIPLIFGSSFYLFSNYIL